MKKTVTVLVIIFSSILLSGCAGPNPLEGVYQAGFWSGVWHGLILPVSFVLSLFSDVSIYEVHNTGGWYDFGFVLGASITLGGMQKGASNK